MPIVSRASSQETQSQRRLPERATCGLPRVDVRLSLAGDSDHDEVEPQAVGRAEVEGRPSRALRDELQRMTVPIALDDLHEDAVLDRADGELAVLRIAIGPDEEHVAVEDAHVAH